MEKRLTAKNIQRRKGQQKIVCLTAYTAPVATVLDNHVDVLLVGDSVGMVLYGMPSTVPVTLDMMIAHGKAVVTASKKACVIIDMPFGSYQETPELAFRNAARILKETGCQGIKMEGGKEICSTIEFLIKRGIPVIGHVGLMPQHVTALGGYYTQGKAPSRKQTIYQDAIAVEEAGAFALIIECVIPDLARKITGKLSIPTIGIGSSTACDGQILVTEDIVGWTEHPPRFVKPYDDFSGRLNKAAIAFCTEVREGKYPS